MTILSFDFLSSLFDTAPDDVLHAVADSADEVLDDYGISNSHTRLSYFLAQLAHESGGFRTFEENLNYSASRLMVVWPKRFPTMAIASDYAKSPSALGNKVYANRLGNGNEASGDGYRYRGRGFIQITGRDNYRAIGEIVGLDLEADPDLAADPENMLLIACGFWKYRKLNKFCDGGDFVALTKAINGGTVGLPDRRAWLKRISVKLKAAGIDASDIEVAPKKPALTIMHDEADALPAPPPAATILQIGSRGEQVKAVQLSLQNLGYHPGGTDGVFGPLTAREVMLFQLQNGLETTGQVDSNFWVAMASPKPLALETERVTIASDTLKQKGSDIVRDGDRTKWLGWAATALGALGIGNSAVVNMAAPVANTLVTSPVAGQVAGQVSPQALATIQEAIKLIPPDVLASNDVLRKFVEAVPKLTSITEPTAAINTIFDFLPGFFAPGVLQTGASGLAAVGGSLLPGFAGSAATVGIGLLARYLGKKIVEKRTEDHRSGANTGK